MNICVLGKKRYNVSYEEEMVDDMISLKRSAENRKKRKVGKVGGGSESDFGAER
jgi:hypothetical protein